MREAVCCGLVLFMSIPCDQKLFDGVFGAMESCYRLFCLLLGAHEKMSGRSTKHPRNR